MFYGISIVTSLLLISSCQNRQNSLTDYLTTQAIEINDLKNRLIDIHKRLKLHWYLPVNSYSLKTVATWTGFKWRQNGSDGARALLWWRQWKNKQGRKQSRLNSLKSIFTYNHDDCLATFKILKWLLEN